MVMHEVDVRVAELAARQAGLFSRTQVHAVGGYRSLIQRRVDSGRWRAVRRDVFLLVGAPAGEDRRRWLGLLEAGERSSLSHEAAGTLHGADGLPGGVVVTVRHPSHVRLRGARLHQSTDLVERHVGRLRGMRLTTPARTVADLAAVRPLAEVRDVAEQLVVARTLAPPSLARMFSELVRPGKAGMRTLAAVLDRLVGAPLAESALERLLLQVLAEAGLPLPELQYPFPGRCPGAQRVDGAYVVPKVAVEADGRAFHARLEAMAEDRRRDLALLAAGWVCVRVGWDTLVDHPLDFVADLRAVLAQRGMPGLAA